MFPADDLKCLIFVPRLTVPSQRLQPVKRLQRLARTECIRINIVERLHSGIGRGIRLGLRRRC